MEALAALPDADVVVCAVVGMAGLKPVLAALIQGTDVALATKEVLVVAGHIVEAACRKSRARILPIDSEQSAVFQCMAWQSGSRRGMWSPAASAPVRRLILTASGGPFASRKKLDFDKVTVAQALAHPNWSMGKKVTIDSATLMNKGLEVMEAHWLFHIPIPKIDVVIHRESIVHSLVEFVDGNLLAQLSQPDMRFAIQYALTYPDRMDGALPPLDLARIGTLTFAPPDSRRFPCLRLARVAGERGGSLPAVLNAANEVAVELFLADRMTFSGIWNLVERVMEKHVVLDEPTLDVILEADKWARKTARNVFAGLSRRL
jgi:1-deoxy-D-xylulose-5-phosphate reductoisomerase